ncbi:hypothetical protein LCI18_006095 [Fusarium solani-melongenae]|uniref:Uncharacterized protein n=1 Tax=Fusarium solani subsp. cucurbitae TaxID=2747967 RepID=A0ACD3Z1T1_FUSSC|nr:hypothetical protein LCI18_006095 [Fusarium solani-melongenae]
MLELPVDQLLQSLGTCEALDPVFTGFDESLPFVPATVASVPGPVSSTPYLDSLPILPQITSFNGADMEWLCIYANEERSDESPVRKPVSIAPKPSTSPTTTETLDLSPGCGQKKRKRFDDEGREKVKNVRKSGACFRCKVYKLSCDEKLPCTSCVKVKGSQKVYRGPCIRLNISEVHAFRAGDGDNGTTSAVLPVYNWPQGGKAQTIKLQWPFRATVNTPTFIIKCEEFQPDKQPLDEEYTANGVVCKVTFPPWACKDTDEARKEVERFVKASQSLLEDEIQETLKDPILRLTWTEAIRYRDKYGSKLIAGALQIYAGAMINSKYPSSVEPNVFGVADQEHTPYFFHKIPLPPQLTYQIQTLVGLVMTDIQKELLKDLKKRVFSKDRLRTWYELFLVIFLLLSTIEWVYQVQIRFVKAKEGVSTRNQINLSYVTRYMIDQWEASAMNLIGHFRCVMNGDVPFAQAWDDGAENPQRTGLDVEAIAYIRNIKHETEGRRDELRKLREEPGDFKFEKPLSAICQLFLPEEEKESSVR